MLDEQYCHSAGGERVQQVRERLGLAVAETRGRFVQQQQAWPRRKGAADLTQPRQAGREGIGPLVGDSPETNLVEYHLGVVARIRTEVVGPPATDLGGDENVVSGREAAEHLELLERACHAETRPRRRRLMGDVESFQRQRAVVQGLQAGDRVEDRGLARAVGTDQSGDAAPLDVEIDSGHRIVTAETHGEPAGFKQCHCSPRNSGPARDRVLAPPRR